MDESKHEIHSQVDAITAGTASVVNLTAGRLDTRLLVCGGMAGRARVYKHECDCSLTHGRDCVYVSLRTCV